MMNLLLRRAEMLLLWGEFDGAVQTLDECLARLRVDGPTAVREIDPAVYERFRVVANRCRLRDRMLFNIYSTYCREVSCLH